MKLRPPSLVVLVLAAWLVLGLGLLRASNPPVIAAAPPAAPALDATPAPPPTPEPVVDPNWPAGLRQIEPSYLVKAPLLHTEGSRQPRKSVINYRVIGGDTIVGIAKRFGISPETILWANERTELNPEFLRIGQELVVAPTTGVLTEVKAGDTVESLAKTYKADSAAITALEFNALAPPFALVAGQRLMVPGGEKPYQPRVVYGYTGPVPENAKRGTGNFVWPISGVLTQQFWTGHRAIDIGAHLGSPVVASDSGYVVLVANDDAGYGRHIMINHGNGFESLYAHLSTILVTPGQTVSRGQQIGLSGSTGRSSGPHLHFEVRYYGAQRNPLFYLP